MKRGLLIAGGIGAGVGLGVAVAAAARRRRRLQKAPPPLERRADRCPAELESRGEAEGVVFRAYSPANPGPHPIVLMHGRGGSEDLMFDALADIALPAVQFYPRGPLVMGRHFAWAQPRSTAPAWPDDQAKAVEGMRRYIAWVGRCYGKPIVAGHSQGAQMAFGMAVAYPELLHAAVGASGALTPALWRRPGVPVVVVHGTEDGLVPVEGARRMRDELGVEIVEVEGHGHSLLAGLKAAFVEQLRYA